MILIENIVVLFPPQHPHEELSSNSIRRGFRRARVSAKRVGTTSSALFVGWIPTVGTCLPICLPVTPHSAEHAGTWAAGSTLRTCILRWPSVDGMEAVSGLVAGGTRDPNRAALLVKRISNSWPISRRQR